MGTRKPGNTQGTAQGPVSPGASRAQEANPSAKAETAPELDLLDALQLVLDLAGMVPGFGAVPDLINSAVSLLRGDFTGALLSAGSAVPAVGDVAGAAKIAKNADKYLEAIKAAEQKVLPMLPAGVRKQLQEQLGKLRAKLDELLKKEKAQAKPKEKVTKKEEPKKDSSGGGSGGGKVKGTRKRRPSRRCELVPYKELECAPGQEAHHVVPDWMLRLGKRNAPERIPGMPSLDAGPAICLEGGGGEEHQRAHKRTDKLAQRVGKSGRSTGTPGTIRLGQAKKISSRAIEKATQGQCTRAEIQRQLDGMFKAHEQAVVRAVKHAGKVTDDVRRAVTRPTRRY